MTSVVEGTVEPALQCYVFADQGFQVAGLIREEGPRYCLLARGLRLA
jgi:hypothetical protein